MPQKRKPNAAAGNQRAGAGRQGAVTFGHASLQNDIVGVVLAIIAIAMLVSLVAPSGAVITHAVERVLTLCFGVGAILCPLTLFLFSLTFFVEGEEPFGGRAALGLLLVSLSILSLISLFAPGAEEDPSIVLQQEMLQDYGGYVGGGVASVLLRLVGKPVGLVLLVGLAMLGVIICGFSVSGFVVRVRQGAERVREVRASARQERASMRMEAFQRSAAPMPEIRPQGARRSADPGKTSFIGGRKTSVLTRVRKPQSPASELDSMIEDDANERKHDAPQDLDAQETTTRKLKRRKESPATRGEDPDSKKTSERKKSPKKTGGKTTRKSARPATAPVNSQDDLVVPEFLRNPKTSAPKAAKSSPRPGDGTEGYELPPLSMLSSNPNSAGTASSQEELDETMDRLQGTLREFGLSSRVVDYVSGPIVTTFRVEMGEGERVSRIRSLEDDIALTLAAEKVRIFAPIPGTSFVGIEIPNKTRQDVHLGDVLPEASGGPLEVAIGRDSSGKPVVADIAKMPHMLVAGTTGSGKSVMINSMIMSLLMRTTPKQVRLIMIDPKRVEFSCYNGLPHLYVPVVTEPRQAASALQWAVSEMERRLKVFERAGAREINVYNRMIAQGKFAESENPPEHMPYLVVIIDELSDLMMVAGKDVEASIVRIAQLARAAGIHLVIATQRPSANVVTGLIKSNIDNRVALKVSSGIDSRVILDETGAERLLGNGDMLFKYRGLNMQRVLGCYTSDSEINDVVEFIRDQAEPDYHEEILSAVVPGQPGAGRTPESDDDDPLVWEAAQIVVESRLGSTSGLQRRLKVGYARAGRIMDMLEAKGVVGPPDGSKPREVLLDEDGLEELRVQEAKYREVV